MRYRMGLEQTTAQPASGNPKSHTEWNSLTPKLQETVLSKLKWNEKEVLGYRLVNSSWKSIVDKVLEEKRISTLTKWDPNVNNEPIFDMIPAIELRPTWSVVEETENQEGKSYTGLDLQYPLPSVSNRKLGTPFPSNTVKISFTDTQSPNDCFMAERVDLFQQFIGRYSHAFSYLKNVLLIKVELQVTSFTTILGHLGNLTLLFLEDICLHSDDDQRDGNLTALRHLKHLKVTSAIPSVSRILLKNYGKQLESLEMNTPLPCFATTRFENLKQLKLKSNSRIGPNELLPLQEEVEYFPKLERFSVCHHEYTFSYGELVKWIDGFPQSLLHLHLDVILDESIERKVDVELKETSSEKFITFPFVHTLGICFPGTYHASINAMSDDIMPKFPNMQTLHFISEVELWEDFDISQEVVKDEVAKSAASFDEVSKVMKENYTKRVTERSNQDEELETDLKQFIDDSDWETVDELDSEDEEVIRLCEDLPNYVIVMGEKLPKREKTPCYNWSEEHRVMFRRKAAMLRNCFITNKCPLLRKISI